MKPIIFYTTFFVSAFQYGTVFSAEEKLAEVAAQTFFEKSLEGLNTAAPYVGVAVQAYHIGQEIRKHNFPTIEEKAYAETVAERFTFLTAENELQRCFIDNRSSTVRNRFGRPVACEDMAKMLTMLGGQNEVNSMTSVYNQYKI